MSSAPEGVCDGVQWGHFLTTFGSLFWTLSEFFLDHFRVTFFEHFQIFFLITFGLLFCVMILYFFENIFIKKILFSSHLCETFLAVTKCQNNFMFVENTWFVSVLCPFYTLINKYLKKYTFFVSSMAQNRPLLRPSKSPKCLSRSPKTSGTSYRWSGHLRC